MPLLTRLSSPETIRRIKKVHDLVTQNRAKAHVSRPTPPVPTLQRRLTVADQAEIIRRYRAGETMKAIAKDFGVHYSTISRCLERAEEPKREPGLDPTHLDEVVRLYKAGASLSQLGRQFRVDGKTIAVELRRVGVAIRKQGRPPA